MTPTERANEIERWFPQRGVPHLIESDSDASILAVRSASHVARGTHGTSPDLADRGPVML